MSSATQSPPSASPTADHGRDLIVGLSAANAPFPIEKWRAHVDNVRHLAVSVFVFSDGRLLLQRRALGKYHSGGLWANTCCSHPRWQESIAACAARRLDEELGVTLALRPFGHIDYDAFVGPAPARIAADANLYENESVHCFVGHADRHTLAMAPDPDEVSDTRWIALDALFDDVGRHPDRYSAWLRIYVGRHGHLLLSAAAEGTGGTRLSEEHRDAYHAGDARQRESLR